MTLTSVRLQGKPQDILAECGASAHSGNGGSAELKAVDAVSSIEHEENSSALAADLQVAAQGRTGTPDDKVKSTG